MEFALAGAGALIVIAWIIGLVDIFRNRKMLGTGMLVVWVLVIVVIPVIGVISWLLYRISKSEAMIEAMDMGNARPDDTPPLPPMR